MATDHARIAAYAQVTMPKPSTPRGGNVYRGQSSPFAGTGSVRPWQADANRAAGVQAMHQPNRLAAELPAGFSSLPMDSPDAAVIPLWQAAKTGAKSTFRESAL
jgi:hypothetical protein